MPRVGQFAPDYLGQFPQDYLGQFHRNLQNKIRKAEKRRIRHNSYSSASKHQNLHPERSVSFSVPYSIKAHLDHEM